MTMPMEYRQASADFDRFVLDVRDIAGLQTANQAYTMVQAVLQTRCFSPMYCHRSSGRSSSPIGTSRSRRCHSPAVSP
jgi:hypothetical protein